MTTKTLPAQARVIVIGGGAVGASIAYHLVKAGEPDVIVIEMSRLTDGATWHAVGLVGQFRHHPNLTRIMQDSARLFANARRRDRPRHRVEPGRQPPGGCQSRALDGIAASGHRRPWLRV